MEVIKSVSCDQSEIIKNILLLHSTSGHIDVDPTYSKGVFYKGTGIDEPTYKFDIDPIYDDVKYADSRQIPLPNNSVEVEMFDPPFLATTGKSLKSSANNNVINKRFGVYPNEALLHRFYVDSMKEAYRILKPNGILIFKCQDKIHSDKQYMSHCVIMNEAVKIGFYPKDLFILIAKQRLIANWQAAHQKNARKYHSYFWVFQKSNRTVQYL